MPLLCHSLRTTNSFRGRFRHSAETVTGGTANRGGSGLPSAWRYKAATSSVHSARTSTQLSEASCVEGRAPGFG